MPPMCRPAALLGSTTLLVAALFTTNFATAQTPSSRTLKLTRADFEDRARAVWTAQLVGVFLGFPFEHHPAAVTRVTAYTRKFTPAIVDDDWYYEIVALRAFEKHGPGLTVEQLGEQWVENSAGAWGSSEQARLALARGVKGADAGHPRHNKLWFTIGPQFSADLYGLLAPGMPNLAGRLARNLGHINGFAEGTDGAVFMAAMVSLAFAEKDPRVVVRKAARLIDPRSPYRQCLDDTIAMADKGAAPAAVFKAIEDRWHHEYPATNNAVPNGCIVAAGLLFGKGDFMDTLNLIFQAADFTDADCNAANAGAVLGAMHGMKAIPPELAAHFEDRIKGDKLGPVKLTPPVDERISDLAKRSVAVAEKILVAEGARLGGDTLTVRVQQPVTQPAELFSLADLMKHWNPDWILERAGFGGAGGGVPGMRGITYLDSTAGVLATWPRDEVRGVSIRRTVALSGQPKLRVDVAADANRAWHLEVMADNANILKRVVEGKPGERKFETVEVDLTRFAGKSITLRLIQTVLVAERIPGIAYWRNLRID